MTPASPDLVILNGTIRTMDPRQPDAGALAIGNGRILAAGDIGYPAGTKTIDLEGRTVIPGMMDGHFHYFDWAMGRKGLNLADVPDYGAMLDRIAETARKPPPGDWIVGQGWNEADWTEPRMPTRADLDAAAPDHPAALWRCDLHLLAVNSEALRRAGVDRDTPDPPEGVIGRDASGEPDGILREMAVNLVKEIIAPPSGDEVFAIMAEGIPVLHGLGITGLEDVKLMDDPNAALALRTWQRLRAAGRLDLRCWVSIPGEQREAAQKLGLRTGMGDERLRIGHLKYFADGGMGARTAWMLEPYLDAEMGMPTLDMDEFREAVIAADRAGLAVMAHAIGDRTNREVIDIFEAAAKQRRQGGECPAIPHRIEHVQMIRPEDVARLRQLGVAACMQPTNMILDIHMIDACVGERGRFTYPFGQILDAGVRTLFSSDAPVCDPNPFLGIHAAATRQRRDGTPKGGWHPEHRISVEAALRGYTLTPAEYYGLGAELGSLSPGKRADLAVLDRDIFTIDPAEIADTQVEMTLFDGRVVYDRSAG